MFTNYVRPNLIFEHLGGSEYCEGNVREMDNGTMGEVFNNRFIFLCVETTCYLHTFHISLFTLPVIFKFEFTSNVKSEE